MSRGGWQCPGPRLAAYRSRSSSAYCVVAAAAGNTLGTQSLPGFNFFRGGIVRQ